MIRIRLADWRDRVPAQMIRREAKLPFDGALYEWLTWPTYHVHLAVAEDDRPMGMTAVVLWPDGAADDLVTYVMPEARERGLAHQLRATQARDLLRMGWTRLYATGRTDDLAAVACATAHFGPALARLTATTAYYGTPLSGCLARLVARGVPSPHTLSPGNAEKLTRKATEARAFLTRLSAEGATTIQKAEYRAQPLEARVHA
jgi:GNAT superfamily N-acetyltransferase